jgi:hypothetical protein
LASSTVSFDGEVSLAPSGCTSDINQFRFTLADEKKLTWRC